MQTENDTPKVVIVTGAAGNLGRAVARAFADQGARLALVDLDPGALESARQGLPPAAIPPPSQPTSWTPRRWRTWPPR